MTTPPCPSRPLWQSAAAFAARKHRDQNRKDRATPYVSHAFRVALTVRDLFGCDDHAAIAAALLHDTIEDTTTDYDEIEEKFGREVADIVASLTKNMALRETVREAEYDARLAAADWRARLIKLADVYDNLCDWSPQIGITLDDLHGRCRRALRLTDRDARDHPESARAQGVVRACVEPAPG